MDREYQSWAVDEIWRYFESFTGNPVIAMPTGTGKSHVIASMIRRMFVEYPSTRIMMVTHVKELIGQNYKKFVEAWPNAPVGIYSAGLKKKQSTFPITFAGIGSVAKKAELFGHIDIVFIDECDLVSHNKNTMYRKFLKDLEKINPHVKVVGLTATPWRRGLGLITEEDGGIFTHIPVNMTGVEPFNWFIDQGYLIPLVSKPTRYTLDISQVHVVGGEYVEKEVQIAVDKDEVTEAALREVIAVANEQDRRKWLGFGSGVQHCKNIADYLCLQGIKAIAVYDGLSDAARDAAIEAYKYGDCQCLVNQNILTTGFDAPETDLIFCLRPTLSSRLWVQMLGRGTRPVYTEGFDLSTADGRLLSIENSPKHNCLIMDFSKNIDKLGPINDPVIPPAKGKGGPRPAPIKECPSCGMYNHASARFCGGKPKDHPRYDPSLGCAEEFTFEVKIKAEASTKEIIKKDEPPLVQTFNVDHITYSLNEKIGGSTTLKVTYYCGIRTFSEWICFNHPEESFAKKKAREWWKKRQYNSAPPIPKSVKEALEYTAGLKAPTHVDVWLNTKPQQIMRFCFDGTEFGKIKIEDPSQVSAPHSYTIPANKPATDDVPDLDSKGDVYTDKDVIPF